MGSPLDMLTTLCGPLGAVAPQGGLLLGLLLAGAAGSPMHCVPMCGGFVLGQIADRMALLPAARLCEWRRLGAGMLLPYHLGRLTTYAGLGALAGLGGAAIHRLPWFGWLSGLLLLFAAALFLAHALRRLLPTFAHRLPLLAGHAPAVWNRVIGRVTRNINRRRWGGGYALGLALGFLPCGFLYAALAAAASSSGPVLGAACMLAFGVGTAPALMVVGVAGQAAGRHWQRGMASAAPAVMLVNAALLAALALRHLVMDV
jgi:sulfite exporter TauE/SafE